MVEIEEPECSICFNKIGERNNCVTPCGHLFCFTCIIEVIRHDSNSCPNCRSAFTENNTIINDNENIINDNENIINDNENIINYNENINNNIINNYINNNENIFNNYIINNEIILNDNILITDDQESTLSISDCNTSISDIPDEELYSDDDYYINPKLIQLYEYEEDHISEDIVRNTIPFSKIAKITSMLLEKGFHEIEIKYIISKNFNYDIKIIGKESIFLERNENIDLIQNELNNILNILDVENNSNLNQEVSVFNENVK